MHLKCNVKAKCLNLKTNYWWEINIACLFNLFDFKSSDFVKTKKHWFITGPLHRNLNILLPLEDWTTDLKLPLAIGYLTALTVLPQFSFYINAFSPRQFTQSII